MDNETFIAEESMKGFIGSKIRGVKDNIELEKRWSSVSKNKKYVSKDCTDEEYDEINDCIKGMKEATKFNSYKKHLSKLCTITGMPMDQLIIVSYKMNQSKGKNYVEIVYNNAKKKITIPNGSTLYHMSPNDSINSLEPQFKGKSAMGYMYSNNRVYFTLRKNMPKVAADLSPSRLGEKKKITTYTPKETITTAWVDPLVPLYSYGAVYVETNYPIKVEKVYGTKEVNESVDTLMVDEDTPTFVSLEEFMNYYGLEYAEDEDVFEESIKDVIDDGIQKAKSSIGAKSRETDGVKHIKDTWKNLNRKISAVVKKYKKPKNESEREELKDKYEIIANEPKYSIYKKAYNWICNFFEIPTNEVVITKLDVKSEEVMCNYSVSKAKKIIIPNGTRLIHVSPVQGIKELKPSFRSKTKYMYLYPTNRVYFSISKEIPKNKAGLERKTLYKYTPKEDIKTAFIDPTYPDFNTGAIFVETSLPIPVEDFDTKYTKESVDDAKISVFEFFRDGKITEEEREFLINTLK